MPAAPLRAAGASAATPIPLPPSARQRQQQRAALEVNNVNESVLTRSSTLKTPSATSRRGGLERIHDHLFVCASRHGFVVVRKLSGALQSVSSLLCFTHNYVATDVHTRPMLSGCRYQKRSSAKRPTNGRTVLWQVSADHSDSPLVVWWIATYCALSRCHPLCCKVKLNGRGAR